MKLFQPPKSWNSWLGDRRGIFRWRSASCVDVEVAVHVSMCGVSFSPTPTSHEAEQGWEQNAVLGGPGSQETNRVKHVRSSDLDPPLKILGIFAHQAALVHGLLRTPTSAARGKPRQKELLLQSDPLSWFLSTQFYATS